MSVISGWEILTRNGEKPGIGVGAGLIMEREMGNV